jgi:hypothetical protein
MSMHIILPCRHEFHLTCINKWIDQEKETCPNCRGQINEEEKKDKKKDEMIEIINHMIDQVIL